MLATHDYRRAVEFYESALLPSPRDAELRHELASLLMKLKQYERAVDVLNDAPSLGRGGETADVATLSTDLDTLLTLANVHFARNDGDAAMKALQRARAVSNAVLPLVRGDVNKEPAQKLAAANVCFKIGEYH